MTYREEIEMVNDYLLARHGIGKDRCGGGWEGWKSILSLPPPETRGALLMFGPTWDLSMHPPEPKVFLEEEREIAKLRQKLVVERLRKEEERAKKGEERQGGSCVYEGVNTQEG